MGLLAASIRGRALILYSYRWWDQEIDLPGKGTGPVLVSPEATASFRWCGTGSVWTHIVWLWICLSEYFLKKKEGHVPSLASPFHAMPFIRTCSSRSSSSPMTPPKLKWKQSSSVVSDSLDPVDCSPPGSSIHGILQARILEWVAISFSRDLLDTGIKPRSPTLQAVSLMSEPPGKPNDISKSIPQKDYQRVFWHLDGRDQSGRSKPSQGRKATICGRPGGEGNGIPLQYSCLENPMDGGAW